MSIAKIFTRPSNNCMVKHQFKVNDFKNSEQRGYIEEFRLNNVDAFRTERTSLIWQRNLLWGKRQVKAFLPVKSTSRFPLVLFHGCRTVVM